jgi:hypothetical protein
MTTTEEAYELAGSGLTVFEVEEAVEGTVRWLDSPQAVLDLVASGDAETAVVLARGGTTTFLAPALSAGVRAVMTLQGAPESHLGILAREYGIPCVMSVSFEQGIRTERGEIVPADGVSVRLDLSSKPDGSVYVELGSPKVDDPGAGAEPVDMEAAERVQLLIQRFNGEIPHGSEGDLLFRAGLQTDVLDLTAESVARPITTAEVNDLQRYHGWCLWDCLAARATEGESGLIPRQEYESVAFVQQWMRHPELYELITKEVGMDGLYEIGAAARREIGTKVNLVHLLCIGSFNIGRGICVGLGLDQPGDRAAEVHRCYEYMRGIYRGLWGGGEMFASMRGYSAPLLEGDWCERFQDECTPLRDPEVRRSFQHFSAVTELLGFLVHYDNRLGLGDTGPYPLPGGGFLIVRDHFLHDNLYDWSDVTEGLPHCVTQAMIFEPDVEMELELTDLSTLFTKPANYLKHLSAMAVYARDSWDTPAAEVRLLSIDELQEIRERCEAASSQMYRRIAAMPRRTKVMNGAQVYHTDFIAPFARIAGLWDRIVEEYDFFEWDPRTSEVYYPLVIDGVAAELVPRLFITGDLFPPLSEAVELSPERFAALHTLAVRGSVEDVPDAAALESEGLVISTPAGYMLDEPGREAFEAALLAEREQLDLELLGSIYEHFLAVNGPFKACSSRWQVADADGQFELLEEISGIVSRTVAVLGRTSEVVPRFDGYADRLKGALARTEEGELDYAVSPRVDSLHTIWMEIHEDYLLTLGRSREEEGSH